MYTKVFFTVGILAAFSLMSCGSGEVVNPEEDKDVVFEIATGKNRLNTAISQNSDSLETAIVEYASNNPLPSSSAVAPEPGTSSSEPAVSSSPFPGTSSSAVTPPPEDPPAEDPPAEDPPAEDPPAEDPPAEDPPAEDPPAEDPPAEDPPAEDPPAEDPPAEDPPSGDAITISTWDTLVDVPTGTSSITLSVTAPTYYTAPSATFRCERAQGASTQITGSLDLDTSYPLNDWSPAVQSVPLSASGTITTDQPISCKLGH